MKKVKKTQALTKQEKEDGTLVIEICTWMNKHGGQAPNKNSQDGEERTLGNRLVQLRRIKHGKLPDRSFKKCYDMIAKKFGYPNLFEMRDRQGMVEEKVKKIISWMKKHKGTPPSKKSLNMEEKKLGEALGAIKQSKKKNSKSHRVFYPSLQKMAEEGGFPKLFELAPPIMKKKKVEEKKDSMNLDKKQVEVIKSKAIRTVRKSRTIKKAKHKEVEV